MPSKTSSKRSTRKTTQSSSPPTSPPSPTLESFLLGQDGTATYTSSKGVWVLTNETYVFRRLGAPVERVFVLSYMPKLSHSSLPPSVSSSVTTGTRITTGRPRSGYIALRPKTPLQPTITLSVPPSTRGSRRS